MLPVATFYVATEIEVVASMLFFLLAMLVSTGCDFRGGGPTLGHEISGD